MTPELSNLAESLLRAQASGEACEPLTASRPDLTIDEAYAIQRRNIGSRLENGLLGGATRRIGYKIGLTSHAIQSWLGIDQPDFGCLLSDMEIADHTDAPTHLLLQPRVEAELAFVLGRDLEGPGVTASQALRAIEYALPALEIIDSRIADWKITYPDTIADNASSGLFVCGSTPIAIRDLDPVRVGMTMWHRGRAVSTGAGAACLGNPIHALVWLANTLSAYGDRLSAGDIILTGALGPAVPVAPGDWTQARIGDAFVNVRFSAMGAT